MNNVIAYDLGTGGLKASIFTEEGLIVDSVFYEYQTFYPSNGRQEQAPEDWWQSIVAATRELLKRNAEKKSSIKALAISGHSLGVVPIDKDGNLLRYTTPIWSDMRADKEAADFFNRTSYDEWYLCTGNGFPAQCYSVFKIMWYKNNEPEMFGRIHKVIGTKDYCNFRFTGKITTDFSYASGSGIFSLSKLGYRKEYADMAGLPLSIFPEPIASHAIIGKITSEAALETGLPEDVMVVCGGVDNACMALGAKGITDGRIYTSIGSSAWIALSSTTPVVELKHKPYVFVHAVEGMYVSSTCIFSAGTSFKWVADMCCKDFLAEGDTGRYWRKINELIADTPAGANGIVFNPSLAGGSMLEPTPAMTGAFQGIKLNTTRGDILRATQEGIALNLRIALDALTKVSHNVECMHIVGGGAKSDPWMQIFANVYGMRILKTNIDQEAASLGAAALALRGIGLWQDYSLIDTVCSVEKEFAPIKENSATYDRMMESFQALRTYISTINN